MALIVVPPMLGRPSPIAPEAGPVGRRRAPRGRGRRHRRDRRRRRPTTASRPRPTTGSSGSSSWIFLLATTVIVAATGLWPATEPAILVLLAFSGLFIVVVHDLLPPDTLGPAKFVVEGSVAITVATLLVALTGGVASPFFFAFPLIVGGAALVVSPPITVGLAAAAAIGYVLAVLAGSAAGSLGPAAAAVVGINLTALILLAYVAMVIARAQRRTRDAAIRLSTVDSLTGLFNRTFFFAAIDREIARSARSGRGFCLLMMDLDELKTHQRPARPLLRRPRPARRRRGHQPGRPPDRHGRPLRR